MVKLDLPHCRTEAYPAVGIQRTYYRSIYDCVDVLMEVASLVNRKSLYLYSLVIRTNKQTKKKKKRKKKNTHCAE
jgi:hypothetical protein